MPTLTPTRIAALALALGLLGAQAFAASNAAAPAAAPAAEPVTVKAASRLDFYRQKGLPVAYRGKTNPQPATIGVLLRGADLYYARCASCHGAMGFGNGQASGALHPRPADLAGVLSSPDTKDDYLFWTIAEGGAQFGTKMPAFKTPDMTDTQIWQIIAYMRASFEGREARATTTAAGKPG